MEMGGSPGRSGISNVAETPYGTCDKACRNLDYRMSPRHTRLRSMISEELRWLLIHTQMRNTSPADGSSRFEPVTT